jgi:hypothetical protein
MLTAAPVLLLILLVPVGLAYAALGIVGSIRQGQFWRAAPQLSELAIYAGVIAAGLALLQVAARRWSVAELRRGWWLLFLMLGVAFSFAAPGALVYFLLPPLLFFLATDSNAAGAMPRLLEPLRLRCSCSSRLAACWACCRIF